MPQYLYILYCLTAYTVIGGDESLPLGEEFQEHVKCFLKPQEKVLTKQFELTAKIVEQLRFVLKKLNCLIFSLHRLKSFRINKKN